MNWLKLVIIIIYTVVGILFIVGLLAFVIGIMELNVSGIVTGMQAMAIAGIYLLLTREIDEDGN